MTQTEYDQQKRECWKEFLRSCNELNMPRSKFLFDWTFDRAYALGKEDFISNLQGVDRTDDPKQKKILCGPRGESGDDFALGKQEKDADTVISGWVAIDEGTDCPCFYNHKPFRKKDGFKDGLWSYGMEIGLKLDPTLFPDLTWDDDPQEVEIIIKRKKK